MLLGIFTVSAEGYASNENLVSQQNGKRITGTVTDGNGEVIIGANVVEKGTTNGVVTDIDGKFTLNVSPNAVLTISYIGYNTQEIAVGNRTSLNISLVEDNRALEEVVVVGYGVQRKVTSTGAVSKVEGDVLNRLNVVNTSKSLQGITPGITVVDRGGAPGSDDPDIYLRGVGTTGTASPLILVDGIEMTLSKVPVNDIESISILKDAASASIYGSRAAHGVILVTTKRGTPGKMKLSYNGYIGFQDMAARPKPVTARQYMEMVNESHTNIGNSPIYSEETIAKTEAGTDPYNYPYTNWHNEVFKKNYITQHTLNIAGGNDAGRYLMLFDYMDQPGLTQNTEYQRYNYRIKADLNIGKMLRVSSDLSYTHDDRLWPTRLGDAQYRAILKPTTAIKYENGNYALGNENINPVAYMDPDVVGKRIYQTDNIIGQGKAEFEPVKDLVFTGVAALNGFFGRDKTHNMNHKFYDANNNYRTQWNATNSVVDERNNRYQLTLRFLANYKKTFAELHSINLLYGMEQISYRNYNSKAERRNLVSDALPDVSLGSASSQYSEGRPTLWGINSFFGRLNYTFKDKYLLEANIRTDGSSRFAQGNKWGVFPSVSVGWRLSEESFLKDISAINSLKLRASWGQTGNNQIGEFKYLPQYATANVIMNGSIVSGVSQTQMSNPLITWETVESADIGLDFSFLDNSIYGELDYYSKDTKDILLELAIPQFIGLTAPPQNAGVVRNSGVELALGYRKVKGEFNYSASINVAHNKNQWVDRGPDDSNISGWTIQKVGSPLNAFYIYQADHLIANDQELAEYKAKYQADPRGMAILKAGDVRLVDANGDGTIDPLDRQIFTPNIPKFTYGINLSADYKNFDLSLFFQGTSGANRIFSGEWYEGPSYEAFVGQHFLDRWTIENQNGNASIPRLEAANNRNLNTYNSFFLKDVSYLRLKNAQLGYTIPDGVTQRIGVEKVRLYLSGSNLLTFSGLDQGLDPEAPSGRPGLVFPQLKIVNFGVNVIF
ncbi:SusC/RagA family TonB-linked outer membrane protein [Bacteroidia bacterium]|nr:SusC/RagA family TonB-linked outer membrane protein [Bacteroidia bacterium]